MRAQNLTQERNEEIPPSILLLIMDTSLSSKYEEISSSSIKSRLAVVPC